VQRRDELSRSVLLRISSCAPENGQPHHSALIRVRHVFIVSGVALFIRRSLYFSSIWQTTAEITRTCATDVENDGRHLESCTCIWPIVRVDSSDYEPDAVRTRETRATIAVQGQ
jgi:hypothetical protein